MTTNENSIPSKLENRFIRAVQESYAKYNEHGPHSTEKLRPLHQWVADEMQQALGQEYTIQGLRKHGQGREQKIAGKYYDKTVDVSISKDNAPSLAIISVKFITSNFKQNANNYFEHLMGETANLRRNNVVFGHLMVLPDIVPYFKRDGSIKHCESIRDAHLQKYVALIQDCNYPHQPDAMGIGMISLPIKNPKNADGVKLVDVAKMEVSVAMQNALRNDLSLASFIQNMTNLVRERNEQTT